MMEKTVHGDERAWFLPWRRARTEVRRGGVPPSSQAEENEAGFIIDLLVYRTYCFYSQWIGFSFS